MAKAVKKVQQEIEGIEATKRNIDNFSKNEIKEAEEWLSERMNETPTEFRTTITIGNMLQWKNSGTMYFPWYQRGDVWDINLKRELITSVANKVHIPDMVFAEKNGKYENIDGKQRINTFDELINNEFTLPTSIPVALGGGRLFKEADKDFQNWFLTRPLGYTYLVNPSDKQCQDTFLKLQQGIKLSTGEMIHGNYGYVAEYIDHIAQTHPVNRVLNKDRFMNYRTLNAMLLLESKYANVLGVDKELEFVNRGQEEQMFDKKTQNIFQKTLQRITYCSGGEYMKGLSVLRATTAYIWLRRNEKLSRTKQDGRKVNEFLTQYFRNNSEIKKYMRTHKKVTLNEEALSYYTVFVERKQSASYIKPYVTHLEEQYELFCKKRMNVFDAKEGNMCVKEE